MVKRIGYLLVGTLLLVVAGAYAYTFLTGSTLISPTILALAGTFSLLALAVFLRSDRNQYTLDRNSVTQEKAKGAIRFIYIGAGLIILCVFATALARLLLVRGAPDWMVIVAILCALGSFILGGALLLFRLMSWWMRYYSNFYRR